MKNIFCCLLLFGLISSCRHKENQIVSNHFIDSLINHYSESDFAKKNNQEMEFWKSRINPDLPGYVNESRYAGCLNMRFRFFGDIDDLKEADSVLKKVNSNFNYKEASVNLALASHSITEHRFIQADSFLQQAKQIGIRSYESYSSSFDVDFELGRYVEAKADLNGMNSAADYGYFFRKSKMDHLNGSLDSAIHIMLRAAELSDHNKYLQSVALSNAADLCIHAGELERANDLYVRCIRINSSDFHSIMGLGWIALVKDKNYLLAKKIFQFTESKNKLPDPSFKLEQIAEAMQDSSSQIKYARAFEQNVTDRLYGRMYNKYLIELYTGVLNNPSRAESIAKDELNNRSTPQTYAWYAWALFSNHKTKEAYQIFEQYVSGKPLEGLELYWMGRLMEDLHKGYNAHEYFKAAYKNRYDLDPSITKYIEERL